MLNRHAIERALGETLSAYESARGGDINEAYRLRTETGRSAFVKTHARPPVGMYEAEARGLELLRSAQKRLRVPLVIAQTESFLILEDLSSGDRSEDSVATDSSGNQAPFDVQLGRGLAELHRRAVGTPGLDHANYIGSLPQDNTNEVDWATFYETRRLRPLVERAELDPSLLRDFETLYARLPELVGEPELSLLHGDLWGGNVFTDGGGEPCLIDPAVYVGDREIDLAMMQLFGGFGPAVFEAYDRAFPRRPGHESRLALYQLYPLLVHVNLFGASYLGALRRSLSQYV